MDKLADLPKAGGNTSAVYVPDEGTIIVGKAYKKGNEWKFLKDVHQLRHSLGSGESDKCK